MAVLAAAGAPVAILGRDEILRREAAKAAAKAAAAGGQAYLRTT